MEMSLATIIFTFTLCTIFIIPCSEAAEKGQGNGLHVGFYGLRCPNAEQIVADVVSKAVEADKKLPAAFIRLFSHDCFVKGCDASILLDSTPSHEPVEMQSPANVEIRGLEVIDEIKARLEAECPETVSCADILAFVAREAVALAGLPRHKVPAGRRDSRTSRATDVTVPGPATPLNEIIDYFGRRGMTSDEVVVLSGAHSIGAAHCSFFDYRLYNYDQTQAQDPALDPFYAADLSQKCPAPNTLPEAEAKKRVVDFDPVSPLVLDNQYYANLMQGKALLQSDQALVTDPRTNAMVMRMAASADSWTQRFVRAMIKMGRINVLTGENGEIRKNCRAFNPL
ncbi:PREDICTED: peroxidase 44-like [Prunus mume]|uniref:Peroxidase n=1 Tax=Prunus mume TaxID=102107 RepID=A0ABM0NAJ5_PRUMU|nr:PREDICTED: peroxidase 44-like [Prunus mume]